MRFEIAIPTHRRPALCNKTVEGIPAALHEHITLFLSDETDESMYGGLKLRKVVTGATNLLEKINYIHFYYEPCTRVFQIEDDVELFKIIEPKKNNSYPLEKEDWFRFIGDGFDAVGQEGIWGTNPSGNQYFMSPTVKKGLYTVPGSSFGFVATRDKDLATTMPLKNDTERSLLYLLKYKQLYRVNYIGVSTSNYLNEGGVQNTLQTESRQKVERMCVDYLLYRYGHIVNEAKNRKSLMPEVKFRSNLNLDAIILFERAMNERQQWCKNYQDWVAGKKVERRTRKVRD